MTPTNVLVILSDEHTRRVLGCYGNRIVRTPHLDALAARGTRFARAYCQTPICVPSRASLATGRWPHAIGAWDNATPYVGTEAPSWGHRLGAQGHHVTTVGKLHYRRVDDPSGFPDQRVPLHVLDGTGDLYGLLRGDMPPRPQSLRHVLDARAGESEYIRYDRAIADDGSAVAPGGSRGRRPSQAVGALRRLRVAALSARRAGCVLSPLPPGRAAAAGRMDRRHVVAPSGARAAPPSARAHDAARRGDGPPGDGRVLRPRHLPRRADRAACWPPSRKAASARRPG